jgi:cytochrome oxidase Cu insertion factor (SCO1/SenC/PrrC family)
MSRVNRVAGVAAWWLALAPGIPAAAQLPKLGFVPPAPGTYRLEHILRAPDGVVLDSDGSTHKFSEFSTGKITVFSFIYTYCTDPKGCPLAYATLHELKAAIEQDDRLRERVRFVSMSFDPQHDTPQAMRSYGGQDARARGGVRWHFLTTSSGRQLAPLLEGFGQDVAVATAQPPGQRVPVLNHLLKVYLIDAGGTVREIYSTSFLHPVVLLNDITTLALEPSARRK